MLKLVRSAAVVLLALSPWLRAGEVKTFRQWIGGIESGGLEITTDRSAGKERIEQREWTSLERMGITVRQEILQTTLRQPTGELTLTWKVSLSSEPMRGQATWSPKEPGVLRVTAQGGSPTNLPVPAEALLWPGEGEEQLKKAARERRATQFSVFLAATQQWSRMSFEPLKADPLPGFPDAVRFRGRFQMGALASDVETWISPEHGELKQVTQMAGVSVLLQRAELPGPAAAPDVPSFFERTLGSLPPHPFLPWLPQATLRWEGPGIQELPQDEQQTKLTDNRFRVRRATLPSPLEAAERPVDGHPSAEDQPFLAPTPLVQFREAAFQGILVRLHPPKDATRWELAKRVTTFVFEWISEKDMSVGFASALEVARIPKGDCTEHGVLAVALLRRLGVPARGVVGWAGLDDRLGLHFWVEVRIGHRWIPIDPTFDQAPASALRLKLGTTDLADLGSIGWDTASLRVVDGSWIPEKPWLEDLRVDGETLLTPDGATLRVPEGHWQMKEGRLQLSARREVHTLTAVIRPAPHQLAQAKHMASSDSRRSGWWEPRSQRLWVELEGGRWLQLDRMGESSAFQFLEQLEYRY